jgi:hypothetical protein
MRRLLATVFGLGLVGVIALAQTADAQTGSLTFDPATATAGGGKVFINGSCEPNTTGFVISHAFANQPSVGEFAGVPAIAIETGSDGTFGIGLTIDPSVKPGHYAVSLRCGGGLAASGTLTVRSSSLAPTGGSSRDIGVLAIALGAVGGALAAVGRRRHTALRRAQDG